MWATQIFYVLKTSDRFPRPLTTSIIYLLLYFTIAVVCSLGRGMQATALMWRLEDNSAELLRLSTLKWVLRTELRPGLCSTCCTHWAISAPTPDGESRTLEAQAWHLTCLLSTVCLLSGHEINTHCKLPSYVMCSLRVEENQSYLTTDTTFQKTAKSHEGTCGFLQLTPKSYPYFTPMFEKRK